MLRPYFRCLHTRSRRAVETRSGHKAHECKQNDSRDVFVNSNKVNHTFYDYRRRRRRVDESTHCMLQLQMCVEFIHIDLSAQHSSHVRRNPIAT